MTTTTTSVVPRHAIRDWSPEGIARVARHATHRAYRRLVRGLGRNQTTREFAILGDSFQRLAEQFIVANAGPALTAAPAKMIIRQLSTVLMQKFVTANLKAERKARP